jgi:AbrB family looped-hinge helix DNA binding protein
MTSVALSPKYQVVIPKAVREVLKLVPGQRLEVALEANGRISLQPELDMRSAMGFLKPIPGVDVSDVPNDPEGPDWPGGCDPIPNADWIRDRNRASKP